MATSESTPPPEKKLLAVSVEEFCKWDDLEQIDLCGLEDSNSDEETTERETRPLVRYQQEASPDVSLKLPSTESGHSESSTSPTEELQKPLLMQQKGHKWYSNLLKFGKRREKYRVEPKSPTGKSKSLSPEKIKGAVSLVSSQIPSLGPPSHKSPKLPQSPGQKMAGKFDSVVGSKEGEYSSSIINLAAITDQVGVPQEVACVSCHKVGILPILYDKQYNIKSASNLMLSRNQKMLNAIPGYVHYNLQGCMSRSLKCVKWKAADISTVYDISDYVSVHIKQCDVRKIAELMELVLPDPLPSWEVFSSVVLRPLRVQMMGSVVACKLALDEGWAINIGGGFGYYTTNIGGGLAVYDDVLVCLAVVSNFQNVEHIGIINLDAYQSPSYQYAKNINCNVTIVDIYTERIDATVNITSGSHNDRIAYHGFDATVDLKTGTSEEYMDYVKGLIAKYFGDDQVKPSLCIYVRGTTVLGDNPHTKLNFTWKDVITQDETIFQLMTTYYNIKIAVLLGGGYQFYDAETSAISLGQLHKHGLHLMSWWNTLKGDLRA